MNLFTPLNSSSASMCRSSIFFASTPKNFQAIWPKSASSPKAILAALLLHSDATFGQTQTNRSGVIKEKVTGKSPWQKLFPMHLFLVVLLLAGAFGISYLWRWLVWSRQSVPQREKLYRQSVFKAQRERVLSISKRKGKREFSAGFPSAFVVDLDQIGRKDVEIVGGKAANLGELSRNGFPVPKGFCITKRAFEMKDNPVELEKVREIVLNKCAEVFGADAIVAVRSSATAEDSDAASFAGQLETYLGIQGNENMWDCVLKCWNSLQSDRTRSYSKFKGLIERVSCCVVVQEMVETTSAGVLFTQNPFRNDSGHIVVTSSWGLGEAVVSDLVTPDTWVIDKESGEIFEREISKSKEKQFVVDTESFPGNKVVNVPADLRSKPSLTENQLQTLVSLGIRLEKFFGSNRDVEWGFVGEKLFVLQARPVTKGSDETVNVNEFDSSCKPLDWLTKSNAQEMFPGAGTPLSISTFGRAANFGIQAMHVAFGVRDCIDENEAVVGWFYGKQFLNMTNSLRVMCGGMIGSEMAKANGEMSILGRINENCTVQELIEANNGRSNLIRRLLNGFRFVITTIAAVPLRLPRMRSRLEEVKIVLRSDEAKSANEEWERLESVLTMHYLDQWADGVTVSSVSAAFLLAVMKILCFGSSRLKPWNTEAVAESSLLISSAVNEEEVAESCDVVQSIETIVTKFVTDHMFMQQINETSVEEQVSLVIVSPEFQQLLERHGHRSIKESEMRILEWSEDPQPLARLVLQSVITWKDHRVRQESTSVDEILSKHAHLGILQRALLKAAARLARIGVRNRELGKSLSIAVHTEMKKSYRRLGALLVLEGKIPDADLLYFFTHNELGILSHTNVDADTVQNMKMIALQRRRLLLQQESLEFKDLYHGKPVPCDFDNLHKIDSQKCLEGTPVSPGIAMGHARVVRTIEEAAGIQPGEILICPQTDVGWTPYFSLASGLVTELGGLLSHGAVVAREYGLPCIVNVPGATKKIETGEMLQINANEGKVIICSEKSINS